MSSGAAWSQQEVQPIRLDKIVLTASSDASVQADGYVGTQAQVAADSLLAASYLDTATKNSQSVKSFDQWSNGEQQRLDELTDLALVEVQKIISAYPERLQDPHYRFSFSIGDCLSALGRRRELSACRIINVNADVATALVAATLSRKIIFLHNAGEHQARALLSFLDEVELPSPVIDGSFFSTNLR